MSISYIFSYIVGIVTITIVDVNERDEIKLNYEQEQQSDCRLPQFHHVQENSTKLDHQDLGLVSDERQIWSDPRYPRLIIEPY